MIVEVDLSAFPRLLYSEYKNMVGKHVWVGEKGFLHIHRGKERNIIGVVTGVHEEKIRLDLGYNTFLVNNGGEYQIKKRKRR